MLEILGAIGGNILSLPGILGLALGMMTRKLWLGAALGGAVGVAETLIFAEFAMAKVDAPEAAIAVVVGILAGCAGVMIRTRGATV